jgi:hypothetical protein
MGRLDVCPGVGAACRATDQGVVTIPFIGHCGQARGLHVEGSTASNQDSRVQRLDSDVRHQANLGITLGSEKDQ